MSKGKEAARARALPSVVCDDQSHPLGPLSPAARETCKRNLGGGSELLGPCADTLYRNHRLVLLRFVGRHVASDRAQDIVQQVFVRFVSLEPGKRDAIRSPEQYLRQSATNLLRDEARSARRQSADLHVAVEDVPLATFDVMATIENRDVLRRLDRALSRLPVRTREIFLAHRFDGMRYAEIAEKTKLSVKAVEKHMTRALQALDRASR